jgi:CRISPR/Cas system-associated exonuclease Cas4 (RecB family)
MTSLQVTEIVTAVRCPRQFVLMGEGHRVAPVGRSSIGAAAHAVLASLATGVSSDRRLLDALGDRTTRPELVWEACYRIAYREAYVRAIQLASHVPGSDLARLDSVTRSLSGLVATLLVRARAEAANAQQAIARAIVASEQPVTLTVGDVTVHGRVDLVCRDARSGMTWIWDLKTYAGSDRAQAEQVRLYAMAYRAQGIEAAAALLHVTDDRVELVRAEAPAPGDLAELGAKIRAMSEWRNGATPPAADDPSTCRSCAAQGVCWARWGRTLPEDDAKAEEHAPHAEPAAGTRSVRGTSGLDIHARRASLDPPALWIGDDTAQGAPALVEPSDLVHHVAIFGSTGSGKTWLAKCLAEEAALAGIPVLAIDMQGDIAQLALVRDASSVRGAALRTSVETRIFTPASDAGLRICLNPLRVPSPSLDEESRGFCMAAIAENLLGAIRIPESWSMVAREYLAQLLGAAPAGTSLAQLVELVHNPSTVVADPLLRSRTRRDTLAEQLRALAMGAQRFLYDKGRRLMVEDLLMPIAEGKTPINVIWLGSVGDPAARQRFVATVLSDVYGWMLGHPSLTPQLIVYLDEAGPFVPPHGDPPAKRIVRRLFQEGRKYGVCGLLCTQNFTDVDYKVLSQAHTVALGRIGAPQDKARARKLLGMSGELDATSAADQLMTAARGTFLVTSTAQGAAPRWIRVRPLLTEHGTPWTDADVMANTPPALREAWRRGRA